MWIGVLGPLEVQANGPVAVDEPELRRLLALLVARRDRSVSTARIAGSLWPGRGPEAADEAEELASRLDMLLPGAVERSPAGCRLSSGVDVDAEEYATLVGAARRLARSDPDRCLELLERAEGLARGEPFEDVPHVDAVEELGRILHEISEIATETRAAALTAAGRPGEAVPLLKRILRRDPLRERPVTLLVEALSAAGRAGDAVRAFERWRVRLVEELGVEPGPEATARYREALALAGRSDPPES